MIISSLRLVNRWTTYKFSLMVVTKITFNAVISHLYWFSKCGFKRAVFCILKRNYFPPSLPTKTYVYRTCLEHNYTVRAFLLCFLLFLAIRFRIENTFSKKKTIIVIIIKTSAQYTYWVITTDLSLQDTGLTFYPNLSFEKEHFPLFLQKKDEVSWLNYS